MNKTTNSNLFGLQIANNMNENFNINNINKADLGDSPQRGSILKFNQKYDSTLSKGDFNLMNLENFNTQNSKFGFISKKTFQGNTMYKPEEAKFYKTESFKNTKPTFNENTNNIDNNANVNSKDIEKLNLVNKPQAPGFRTKTYNVKLIKRWFEKNNIPVPAQNSEKYSIIDFQSNNITDQIKVLLDNLNYFKLQYLQGKDV